MAKGPAECGGLFLQQGYAFMGAVLVAEGDRILLDKGYGMASLEWGVETVQM